jgi:hypothetical protein
VMDKDLKAKEAKGENVKKQRRRWKETKAAMVHEPGAALPALDAMFTKE